VAYVDIVFHRDRGRVRPHIQYIADREHSRGLRGLGQEFRQLNGDVERVVRLFHEHAASVRAHLGAGDRRAVREGPFHEMTFTLPTDLARRVTAAGERLSNGSEYVLQDATEALFRSVGRHLQGVYAVHFNSLKRDEHPHVHVALSPLDAHGRTTFVTKRQRDALRVGWEREIVRALDRSERRERVRPRPEDEPAPALLRSRYRPYVPVVAALLLGRTGTPLFDLFLRALAARTEGRRRVLPPLHAARYGLSLPVPLPQVRLLPAVPRPAAHFTRRWLQ
jgi:hypothetical protein